MKMKEYGLVWKENTNTVMRNRGTRIDDLKIEPIGEDRPGYYRMLRMGNFSKCEGSVEMIVNKKELENFVKQATAILKKESEKNGEAKKSV